MRCLHSPKILDIFNMLDRRYVSVMCVGLKRNCIRRVINKSIAATFISQMRTLRPRENRKLASDYPVKYWSWANSRFSVAMLIMVLISKHKETHKLALMGMWHPTYNVRQCLIPRLQGSSHKILYFS